MNQEQVAFHPSQAILASDQHRFRVGNCGRRFGKALALDTPILTIAGFKNMIDLRKGDIVFDEGGNQVTVLYKSEIYYNRECYLVEFSDGAKIVADKSHDWVVENKKIRKSNARNKQLIHKPIKMTTGEMAADLNVKRADKRVERNFSIQTTAPLKIEARELKIPPYFLGLWLGDGNTLSPGITTVDEEIITHLGEIAKLFKATVKKRNGISYFITGKKDQVSRNKSLQAALNAIGVLGNKHIPIDYILAGEEQRLELLRGLMDSDGYAGKQNNEYTTTSKVLAKDVSLLMDTLGIKNTVVEYDSYFYEKLMGKKYRINFNTELKVFKLKRKKQHKTNNIKNKRRYITNIEKIDSVPVQCLMVDSDSHLFLAGERLVPTHNTFEAVYEMLAVAASTKDGKIAYVANTYQQAKDIAWEELKQAALPITVKTNESDLQIIVRSTTPKREPIDPKHPDKTPPLVLNKQNKYILTPSTSTIRLRGWESVNNLRGQKFHFLVLDEVAFMKEFTTTWNKVLLPALTDYTGKALFLSTPNGFNHFYDLFNRHMKDPDYSSHHFPSRKNPYLKGEVIDKAKQEMTEDEFAQEYEAEFKKKEGLVYKTFSRQRHVYNPNTIKKIPEFIETFYGIDFGFTNPSAVLVIRKDKDFNYWITGCIYERQLTNTQLIEKVKGLTPQPRYIYADPAEPDRIKEFKQAGYYMREVTKGKGSIENGIQRVQELFKTNRIKISTECVPLIEELEMYSYPSPKEGKNDSEKPIAEFDHCLDGLSYALRTHDPSSHGLGQPFNTQYMNHSNSIEEAIKRKHLNSNKKNRNFD